VPLLADTGELVSPVRATVLRMALAEGLRVLARRYGRERGWAAHLDSSPCRTLEALPLSSGNRSGRCPQP
jgi:hypothetical protein